MNVQQIAEAIDVFPIPVGPCHVTAAHVITSIWVSKLNRGYSPAIRRFPAHKGCKAYYEAIGGPVTLTKEGRRHATRAFDASKIGSESFEADFQVPNASAARNALAWLMNIEYGRRGYFDDSPHRAVFRDLCVAECGQQTLIDDHADTSALMQYTYLGACLQPSLPQFGDVPRVRLSHLWQMRTVEDIYFPLLEAHKNTKQIVFLNAYDLETTHGGTKVGTRKDGTILGCSLGLRPIVAI